MKNEETMNIVFSSDVNYAPLVGVALCSIFENKKGNYPVGVHILDGGISDEDINKLGLLEKRYNFKINYIKVDTSLFQDFYTRDAYTQANYYRIIIPELLPQISKILYLDADIIVLDDIYELYNKDIRNYLFAAAVDIYINKSKYEILKIPKGEKYFNSGVLLMNLDKCREENTSKTILKFVNENSDKLEFCDQDAINATMVGRFLEIEQKYNFMIMMMTEKGSADEIISKNNIKIIHYTGKKPWDYFYKNVMNKKYFYYLRKTPWRNKKYKNKTLKLIYKNYKEKTWNKEKEILPQKIVTFLAKALSYVLSKKTLDSIRDLKRKLGIKFY